MPSETPKQRRFMGAELARERAGKRTRTGMSERQLSEFASKNPGHHGGVEMKKVGQARQRVGTAGGSRGWQGGPPAEGFHRLMPSPALGRHDPAGMPQGKAVARQAMNPHKHLGRFATGSPRKGVGKKSTSVHATANH